jgi:hypothetical protein
MRSAKAGVLVSLVAVCGAAQAGPHSVTYSQISVAPGTQVTIAGQPFVAAQLPMRQFTVDSRYAVRFLVPREATSGLFSASLETEHSTDPLPSTNATIDGFPAQIDIVDGRRYTLSGGDLPTPSSTLLVQGQAYAFIRIKVGDTLVILYASLSQDDHVAELTSDIHRGTSQAAYGRYTDPVTLVGAQGLDKWVDYIRVIPLN